MTIWTSFHDPATTITAELGEDGPVTQRSVTGTAVPWNQNGRVSDGSLVRFLPGSLDAAARPILVHGHDASHAIGRVSDATDTEAGMSVRASVSRTRDGDDALVLAADGVLGMFSVGVNPTDYTIEDSDEGPVLVVAQGEWQHLALLPYGAFTDALVTDVAASAPTQGDTMPESSTVTTEAPPAEVEAAPPTPPERPAVVPISTAPAAAPSLGIAGVAAILAEANRTGVRAADVQARINAALTNVTTTNLPSPPAYRTELVGLIDHGAPLASRLQTRPLPESGMEILAPRWTAFPDSTAKQAGEKTAIASGDVSWAWGTTPIETWAQGNDLSLQAVQRSNPSAMDAYLRAAGIDAAKKWDINVANKLMGAGSVATTEGADFLATVANLLGGLNPASVPPGNVFIAMQYAEAMSLVTVKKDDAPAFWDASISLSGFMPSATAGGIDFFIDPYLPVKYLAGIGTAAATYGGPPTTDIRVVDVSLLGVDVGVYFFGAVTVEYPTAFSYIP